VPTRPDLRFGTAAGNWVLAATVLGSGIAFLDGTVVNVALPAIGDDLGASLSELQWVVNGYLVTLSSLLLLGGALGDRMGRRSVFVAGLVLFVAASASCGLAPNVGLLIGARAVQGVGGALLVPASLAVIASTFHPDDRGRAVGAWSGLSGVTTSVGPFLGGWLIDAVSWRAVFLLNVPLVAVTVLIALRKVPDTRAETRTRLDVAGSVLVTTALAGASYAAIEHRGPGAIVAGVVAVVAFGAFLLVQLRARDPMLPLGLFRSRQFSGANLVTLAVYAGLGGAMFLVVLRLQVSLGYSALEAGAALVPVTILLLVLSPSAGALGTRIGPRIPMTVGPLVAAAGLAWLATVEPGSRYLTGVAPPIVVFGLGLSLTVAPLTTAVLDAVDDAMSGVASGVNNAVSRLAGLLAVAALPALAGIATDADLGPGLDAGYATAMRLAAAIVAVGGGLAWLLIRATVRPTAEGAAPAG
jgi:EmrB/QacA subfamily drug resistance transporter